MTIQDAIYEIKQLAVLSTNKNIDRITEALEMAIDALERAEQTEPQTDCGSCEYSWWNGEKYRCMRNKCPYTKQTEPQKESMYDRYRDMEYDMALDQTDCSWK